VRYQRNWVLAAYRADHQNKRDPSAQTLEDFDALLADLYDDELTKQAGTITLDKFKRSILAYFASRSEATNPATQVKHAYEFFRNTSPTP